MNLSSFMAVTAHWIESITTETLSRLQKILNLRADLVGFHHVPGRHDRKHLAHAFLFVTDRLDITEKVTNPLS